MPGLQLNVTALFFFDLLGGGLPPPRRGEGTPPYNRPQMGP